MNLELLRQFCSLHSTPGDEGGVFALLLETWKRQGLDVRKFGNYAVTAMSGERKKSDTILLVAHADSPGFTVCGILSPTEISVLTLGGTAARAASVILKTSTEVVEGVLEEPPEEWRRSEPLRVTLSKPCTSVQKGDRLCWAFHWEQEKGRVCSPFLDNRIACALVAEWYDAHQALLADYNVIVAATAMEEVNGFGASVLARQVGADAVIALDVTYEAVEQEVFIGQGPVITLSDASVILSPAQRDRILTCGVPLQTEVYNYSGTDAKAFPTQGLPVPVCAVLLATAGNHSPREEIAISDLEVWPRAVAAVAKTLVANEEV